MPNHVMNILKIEGVSDEKFKEIATYVKGNREYGEFDFNAICPMPESLNIECGTRTDRGYEAYKDYKSIMDDNPGLLNWRTLKAYMMKKHEIDEATWDLGHKAYDNMKKYGDMTWYQWCTYHWGTKWNAYECTMWEEGHVFQFETAWNSCYMIVCKLSNKFPDVKMTLKYADEDIGYNAGIYTFFDNGISTDEIEDGSKEAFELASRIWGIDLEDLGFVYNEKTGTYELGEAPELISEADFSF